MFDYVDKCSVHFILFSRHFVSNYYSSAGNSCSLDIVMLASHVAVNNSDQNINTNLTEEMVRA